MCRCGGAESGRNASSGTSRLSCARIWRAIACASGVSDGATAAAKLLGEFLQRTELVPQPLRHRLGQRAHLLLQQARHQPLAARRRHLVEQRHRHRHGDAVARGARLELVLELEGARPEPQLVREILGGDARRLVAHQVFAAQVEQLRVGALRLLAPGVEGDGVVDPLRHALVVERVHQLVVDQDVRAARLVLEALDVGREAPVVGEERRARLEIALHQRGADEDRARRLGIERPVVHLAVGVHRQAVERAALDAPPPGRGPFPSAAPAGRASAGARRAPPAISGRWRRRSARRGAWSPPARRR